MTATQIDWFIYFMHIVHNFVIGGVVVVAVIIAVAVSAAAVVVEAIIIAVAVSAAVVAVAVSAAAVAVAVIIAVAVSAAAVVVVAVGRFGCYNYYLPQVMLCCFFWIMDHEKKSGRICWMCSRSIPFSVGKLVHNRYISWECKECRNVCMYIVPQ
jgi:hypothetical protein